MELRHSCTGDTGGRCFGSGLEKTVRPLAQVKTHRGCLNGTTRSWRLATEHPTPSYSFWRSMRCQCYSTVERMRWHRGCCIHGRFKAVWRYANIGHQCFAVCDLLVGCRRCHRLNRRMRPSIIAERCKKRGGLVSSLLPVREVERFVLPLLSERARSCT